MNSNNEGELILSLRWKSVLNIIVSLCTLDDHGFAYYSFVLVYHFKWMLSLGTFLNIVSVVNTVDMDTES